MQHDVEVKQPTGRDKAVDVNVNTTTSGKKEIELKPAYGQKIDHIEVKAYGPAGSRTDVEVKPAPYGTTEVIKPQQRTTTTTTTTQERIPVHNTQQYQQHYNSNTNDLEKWRNPLLATLLGITLALALLSLSYLPRAISGAWHWGEDKITHRHYKQSYSDKARDKASDYYHQARDQVDVQGDRIKHRARDIVDSVQDGSVVDQARRLACRAAQRAEEAACDGVDMHDSWTDDARDRASGIYERARDFITSPFQPESNTDKAKRYAYDARDRAYEQAEYVKDRARGYSNYAQDEADSISDRVKRSAEYAKDRAQDAAGHMKESVKDRIENNAEYVKDRLQNGAEYVKDKIYSGKHQAEDVVEQQRRSNMAQRARDSVADAAEGVKNFAANTVQGVKDTVAGATTRTTSGNAHTEVRGEGRDPIKVKVEVTEL